MKRQCGDECRATATQASRAWRFAGGAQGALRAPMGACHATPLPRLPCQMTCEHFSSRFGRANSFNHASVNFIAVMLIMTESSTLIGIYSE